MAIEHVETIDLEVDSPNDLKVIHAVQGEYYSRKITANLLDQGSSYTIPANTVALIRYRRADGVIGFYDFDPVGNRVVTINSGNHSVTFTLSDDLCAISGRVSAHLDLYSIATGNRLSAFYFLVDVEKAATDQEIYHNANVTGMQDLLKDIIGSVYTPSSEPQEGAIIDNTLSIPGAVGDAKAMGDVVLVQDTQPDSESNPTNKIWVNTELRYDETEIPEMSDIAGFEFKDVISVDFDPNNIYNVNDIVRYNNKLYICVVPHGRDDPWDSANWTPIQVCSKLTEILNILDGLVSG